MNRKVPIGIVGSGRVARHFCFYLDSLGVPYINWYRRLNHDLDVLNRCDAILLLVSDSAIKEVSLLMPKGPVLVHFSGSLVLDNIYGCHPLMTFSHDLYGPYEYAHIPFVVEDSVELFQQIFPFLPNKVFAIKKDQKALYHAMCVIAGNFSTIIWSKVLEKFDEMELSSDILWPYLERVLKNCQLDIKSALTGPLVRKDQETIEKNLSSLANDPYQKVYQVMLETWELQ